MGDRLASTRLPVRDVAVDVLTVPTDAPESDGTLRWDSTTIVVVQLTAGDVIGLGWTYGDPAVATLITGTFSRVLDGTDAFDVRARWVDLYDASRNLGRRGIASYAISALDIALWDAKARALGVSLVDLLGAARARVPIYGSGGFTSYDDRQLSDQLAGWVHQGVPRVKMKVGREPADDPRRVAVARDAIGDLADLYVDANGAYTVQQALACSSAFADHGVTWHEEPVSSEDREGLRHVRQHAPAGMDIAAGEYVTDAFEARSLMEAEAVDCLQADVTRCGGITGFSDVAALCWAHQLDLSGHCAPQVSVHAAAAAPRLRHLEYFHDHVRVEQMLFDGALEPEAGALAPDRSRPGLGLAFKRADAVRFAA